jgi:phage head maturation protease
MERFARGSLSKTMRERASKVRVLFEHGLDSVLGRQAIAEIEEMRDEADGAYFRARLLDGLPPLLVSGLRRGLYGSSVRFKPVLWERNRSPKPSESNPTGMEERTVTEGFLRELSVVTFAQYAGATAHVRSLTDEFAARQLLGDPERFLEVLRSTSTTAEPPHSEREVPEAEEAEAPAESRSTQPVHDYLAPEEDDSAWRL